MADFHRILYPHSLYPGPSLPFHVSPLPSFPAVRFSPPLRLSCPTIFFCRSSYFSTSPSSSLPSPNELEIVSSNECPDGSFLFKFGDPSEIEKDVHGSGGSSLGEGQSLAEDDEAVTIDSAVDEEKGAVSCDDIVSESVMGSKESGHVVEFAALHSNSSELDEHLGTGSAVVKQNALSSMTENRTNIYEESVDIKMDDSNALSEAGIIVDTQTVGPFQEEVSGKINQNDSLETTTVVDTKTSSPSEVSQPSQEFDDGDAMTSQVFDDPSALPEASIAMDTLTISPFQEEVSGKINQNDFCKTTMAVDTKTSSPSEEEVALPSQEFDDGGAMTSQVFDDPSALPEGGTAMDTLTVGPFQEEASGKVNQSDSPETVMAVDTMTGSLSVDETSQEFDDGDATTSQVFDDLVGSLGSGTVTDIHSVDLSQEEAAAQINDDDVMASKVSFDPEMSCEGYSSSKLDMSGGIPLNDDPDSLVRDGSVVDDDFVIESLPENVKGEAGLSSNEEVANNLPSDLLGAEIFQNPVLVDDGACPETSSDVRTDIVKGNNNFTDFAVGVERADTAVFREEISIPTLALASGVASLTCPSQELAGAEDAYVVAGERWFIVANIVAEWSLEGMKAGIYGHELLGNCRTLISGSGTCDVNVREVLEQSAAGVQSPGLLSVLIAHFHDGVLHVANVGDTRFIIVRNGCIHRSSSPHFHEFNFPVQIRRTDDPMEVTMEYEVNLEDGDVIVMATDGLFDNLYPKDIASIVSKSVGAKMKPKEIAELLAMRAQEVGRSTSTRSPFSDEAQAAGYAGYSGGKLDHVTVIVSFVKKQSSPQHH